MSEEDQNYTYRTDDQNPQMRQDGYQQNGCQNGQQYNGYQQNGCQNGQQYNGYQQNGYQNSQQYNGYQQNGYQNGPQYNGYQQNGYQQNQNYYGPAPGSNVVTVDKNLHIWLWCFLLGGFGVDRFVRGQIALGVCKLLFGWLTFGIWPLVDWIIAMVKGYGSAFGHDRDFIFIDGAYSK